MPKPGFSRPRRCEVREYEFTLTAEEYRALRDALAHGRQHCEHREHSMRELAETRPDKDFFTQAANFWIDERSRVAIAVRAIDRAYIKESK